LKKKKRIKKAISSLKNSVNTIGYLRGLFYDLILIINAFLGPFIQGDCKGGARATGIISTQSPGKCFTFQSDL
jgi:hypothetical protein